MRSDSHARVARARAWAGNGSPRMAKNRSLLAMGLT